MSVMQPDSEQVKAVVDLIQSVEDASYDDDNFHRHLYDTIKCTVLPTVSSTSCPPLPVIVYAIRRILEPSFMLQELPNLCKLMIHLEVVRKDLLQSIRRLLSQSENSNIFTICAEYRDKLEQRTKATRCASQRTTYCKILNACFLLHIHYIWRTFDPERDRPLLDILIDYFPAFVEHDSDLRERCLEARRMLPWHHDCSEEDYGHNYDSGKLAAQFVYDAANFHEDLQEFCRARGLHDVDTPFDDIFPPQDTQKIANAIMQFVGMVTKTANTLDFVLEHDKDGSRALF